MDEKIEQVPVPKMDGPKTGDDAPPSSHTAAEGEETQEHKARPEREATIKDLVVSVQCGTDTTKSHC
jgi:hypothetical protein